MTKLTTWTIIVDDDNNKNNHHNNHLQSNQNNEKEEKAARQAGRCMGQDSSSPHPVPDPTPTRPRLRLRLRLLLTLGRSRAPSTHTLHRCSKPSVLVRLSSPSCKSGAAGRHGSSLVCLLTVTKVPL
ncbi:hypothetical protein ASPBRDRAFT_289745 [Aspergillus brasiliensis CBS 101740]|uniref:Uncharacterized protein n=1 Tax=Aspergillus brasiliensis (strain CBS 101740 / IMI 381727 / IBT 21946) TaxID=767769 RepID=A0A1L9UBH1_ASPBC|nr:hypothetical protein ASPBRDRAFT_289745 [Aspergillus brasiliensis CBS 101740]